MTDYGKLPDQALVELTLFGDEHAFETLVLRHQGIVMSTALKITGNTYSAQDASQDAFFSAWMGLNTLGDPSKFRPWIRRIAKNSAIDLVRHYRATASDISLDADLLEDCEVPELALEGIESEEEARDMLSLLDTKIREAVELHYFEGYSVKEIAEKTGDPTGTVKWRLSEGRKLLRKGYGAMEEYNEKEEIVRRVMRQVEKLKLWHLKESKAGFAEEYREVLKNVEALDESPDKDTALAGVLLMGYRWLDNIPHRITLSNIKALAENSGDQELMLNIAAAECGIAYEYTQLNDLNPDEYDYEEYNRIVRERYVAELEKLLPYYAERGYALAECRILMNICIHYIDIREYGRMYEYLEKIIATAPGDSKLFHEAAQMLDMYVKYSESDSDGAFFTSRCFELRAIEGKLCYWTGSESHAFGYAQYRYLQFLPPFCMYLYDGIIYDPSMKPGQTVVNSSGGIAVTLEDDNAAVDTPAGRISGCRLFIINMKDPEREDGRIYYHPGIGFVKTVFHVDTRFGQRAATNEVVLSSYGAVFDGLVPRVGSRWDYEVRLEHEKPEFKEFSVSIVSADKEKAIAVMREIAETDRFDDSWEGDVKRISYIFERAFAIRKKPGPEVFEKALERDITPRQRTHIELMCRVFAHIMATSWEFPENKDRIADSQFDRFDVYTVKANGGSVTMEKTDEAWNLRYTPFRAHVEGQKLLHNQFIAILSDSTGFLWNDKWVPGYSEKYNRDIYGMKDRELDFHFVRYGETVTVPAGTFENCVHIQFDMRGLGDLHTPFGYRGGWADYWFAPGIGLVRHFRLINNTYDCFWQLTEYRGTGEGYFPINDGLFRRYEPADLKQGFISSLEITFAEDGGKTYMFADGEGSQIREEYRKESKERKDYYENARRHDPRREKYMNLQKIVLDRLTEWDPFGFAAAGSGDEYIRETHLIVTFALYGAYDHEFERNVKPETVEDCEEFIRNNIKNSAGVIDDEKIRELAEAIMAEAKKKYEWDEYWRDYTRTVEDMFLDKEFDGLLDIAKRSFGLLDGYGGTSQIIAVDTVKRNVYTFVIPDPPSNETDAEKKMIDFLREKDDTAILRMVCMRKNGGIDLPSRRLRNMLVEANEANGFTAVLVEKENGKGIRRLVDYK